MIALEKVRLGIVAEPPAYTFDEARLGALSALNVLDSPAEAGFDDIVELAAHVCAAPVALVSLVDRDRQWFKARVGFPACETDLNSSVCAYVLVEPDILIIPDLTEDPRTRANPLVTGDAHIRFYAGAPLRLANGHVLGSLCVIDGKPRPEGLTPAQADALRNLARQVMTQLALRQALRERDGLLEARRLVDAQLSASQVELSNSEAYWRGLFERLSEGFIIGEVLRDEGGRIVDWRYVDVNSAWGELVGVDPTTATGRTIRQVFPGIEDAWVQDFAQVVDGRESVLFTRRVGTLRRWYEGRSFPLEGERFAVLFLEVTARVQAELRRNALLRVGDLMREMTAIPDMTRAAAEIVGTTLQASRAGFGRLEAGDEYVVVETDWTAPLMASVVGRHQLDDYGALRGHLLEGTPVVIENVLTDPRTMVRPDRLLSISVRALVNMPVRERGRTVAVLIVHDQEPRPWEPEDLAFIRNVADRVEAGVARLRAEAEQKLLNEELSHRMKNMMAMVQAIAGQTLKSVPDREPVRVFEKRIHALSAAHDVLLQQNWSAAQISAVVHSVLATFDLHQRFAVSGPATELGPRATLSLSLLLHEMTTNALKYGSLSSEAGRVTVTWRLDEEFGDPVLILVWREQGGPPAQEPKRKGFGTRLIRMGLVGTGGVELRYAPTGLEAEFTAPLSQVQLS